MNVSKCPTLDRISENVVKMTVVGVGKSTYVCEPTAAASGKISNH